MRPSSSLVRVLPALVLALLASGLVVSPAAWGQGAWWRLNATAAPSDLPAEGEAQLVLTATNVGDQPVDGSSKAVTISYELPAKVTPVGTPEAHASRGVPGDGNVPPPLTGCEAQHLGGGRTLVGCRFTEVLPPFEHLLLRIPVELEDPTERPLVGSLKVEGGGATAAQLSQTLDVQGGPTPFGVEEFAMTPEEEGGASDFRAGSHPFQLTTTLNLDETLADYATASETGTFPSAPALPHDLHFKLPPGLVGNVGAVPQCSKVDFSTPVAEDTVNLCPPDTAIGVASLVANDPVPAGFQSWSVPVFNLTPEEGEPARFGFLIEGVPVILRTAVPTGGEYGVEVSVQEISQAVQLLSSQVTFWGVPGDPRHDSARGWECLGDGTWYGGEQHAPCQTSVEGSDTAFLTLPTSCAGVPQATVRGSSWGAGATPPQTLQGQTTFRFPTTLQDCEGLTFEPSIEVEPEERTASTPTGLTVNVHVPQQGLVSGTGRAEPALRETTVTLPPGLLLSPAAANGLTACTAEQFGSPFAGSEEGLQISNESFLAGFPDCPDAAKVGTVEIQTPLLAQPLTGSVYLAAEHTDPFQAPLVVYLVAEDRTAGVLVKLAGTVTPDPRTGQLVSTFSNTPQLPFESLTLHFFGGQRASLSTPSRCGAYETEALFTPWSGAAAARAQSSFAIAAAAGGGPCPGAELPFAPGMQAGSQTGQAGAFTSFEVELEHADGDQQLTGVAVHLPPGLAAILRSVPRCGEPQAALGQCGPESEIGQATASAGLGGEPFVQSGRVYLTGPYDGAPFGLSIVTPAIAGPFDLGDVVVRAAISVDPHSAAVTVSSVLPTIVQGVGRAASGVPLQLKRVRIAIDRPDFQFNPTNCSRMQVTGELAGAEGATHVVSDPFTATGCSKLPFKPGLTAATQGQASRADGAALTVRVTSGPGQANIAKTVLTLPKQLPSRQSTIRLACLAATFEANPSSCPEGSLIGSATVRTPVLAGPLQGPAYLVSHGGAAFPDVEFVLQGEGVLLILDGKTNIHEGVTTSSFESVPDAPIESFQAVLPEGPHSALGAYLPSGSYDLCGTALTMPTVITGQNGTVIEQDTRIATDGCSAVASYHAAKPTRAQRLKRALKACRKRYEHSRSRRSACEAAARRTYRARKATAR